jgi:hypothetical protein
MSISEEENNRLSEHDDNTTHVFEPSREDYNNVIDIVDYRHMKPGLLTKTRVTMAAVAMFFAGIILFGEMSLIAELIPSNGLTRTDVGKYRVDIFETPSLQRVANKMSTLNCTANLEQLGWSKNFRASDEHDHYAYFKLKEETDFEKVEPQKSGILPGESSDTPSHFSLQKRDGKIFVLKNDVEIGALTGIASGDMENWDFIKCPPLIFNYGKSAVIYRTGKTTLAAPGCAYIEDLNKPVATPVTNFQDLETGAADRFGKQFFALSHDTIPQTAPQEMKLVGANFDGRTPVVATFPTSVVQKTALFHCAPAATLALIDTDKIRIVDARNGEAIAVHFHRDLFSPFKLAAQNRNAEQRGEKTESAQEALKYPRFDILPGVPAALFGGKLIDMRNGNIVDTLHHFEPDGVFAVDHTNKKMYYSTNDFAGAKSATYMSLNAYDLDRVSFEKQVVLGPQSYEKVKAKGAEKETIVDVQRLDSIRKILLLEDGKLAVLTAPAE